MYGALFNSTKHRVEYDSRILGQASSKTILANLANGQLVSICLLDRGSTTLSHIRGRGFLASLTVLGSYQGFAVTDYKITNRDNPSMTSLINGNYVVVWEEQTDHLYDIFGQLFNDNHMKISTNFQINNVTEGYQTHPYVASLRNGDFIVTWDTLGGTVSAQRFSINATRIGNQIVVDSDTTYRKYPTVSGHQDGGYIIVWSGNHSSDTSGIIAQRFSSSNDKTFINGTINQLTPDNNVSTSLPFQSNISTADRANNTLTTTPTPTTTSIPLIDATHTNTFAENTSSESSAEIIGVSGIILASFVGLLF